MLRTSSRTLDVGDPAPAFDLPTASRSRVRLADFRGRCLLVIFIRGTWCPNCTKQMSDFASSFSEFEKRRIGIVFIAAQKIDGFFKGKEHVDKNAYPFPLLFDEDRRVSRDYGVRDLVSYDTINLARRSIFLVDGEGSVRWIAVSPHQWEAPGIQDILKTIESCGKC
jgi:peroxiredoxin Q/BCP